MKGMLGMGKKNEEKQDEAFTLERFESQIKQARRFAGVGQLMGRAQSVEARAMLRLFENSEKILGAMSAEEKQDLQKLNAARKASLAESVGLTPKDVDDMMTQYDVARQTSDRLAQMKREGKPMPKTIEEMQKFAAENMGTLPRPGAPRPATQSAQPAPKAARVPRNALCPCGSKKKYKRCCGRDEPGVKAA
ncbi:hypothetical protein KFL_004640040 [Klebsormidium nitens]|uniref:Signal recognition particle SRP54 subunit M-domain domain-containing protein n=1 Tax=Klebsormidium nitens TaxID=105231 RepID=A0A1Y1IJP3_KLENI|nr:hypothetical protein KFL_004640040 [Klebsormidium nitens]|eukprot:GAQ88847.1 hypothetical protein KFL_004640040 [Klebsormidium nitens]